MIFADDVESPIALLFINDLVVTIVPEGAETGDVRLETGGELSSSRAAFRVVPAPPARSAQFDPQVGTPIPSFNGGCGSDPLDDGFAAVPLPFSFPFYGRPQTQMFVTTNGVITFGEAGLRHAERVTDSPPPTRSRLRSSTRVAGRGVGG